MKGKTTSSKDEDVEKTIEDTKTTKNKVRSLVTLLKKKLIVILIVMMKK